MERRQLLLEKLTDADGELKSGKEYAWNIARVGFSSGLSADCARGCGGDAHGRGGRGIGGSGAE